MLIVGAGPVGRALLRGLQEAELPVLLWSRREGRPPPAQPAAVVLLAVRDEAIGEAAESMLRAGAAGPGSVLLHCAGALPPEEALAAQRGRVRGLGLLHPLRSLSSGQEDLRGTVMALCGDEAAQQEARRLVAALGGVPLPLEPAQLAAYHGAAALCAGHAAALLGAAVEVLVAIGLDRRHAEQALAALCQSMTDNVLRLGLPAALTGPIARGDVATVRRHLQALPRANAEAARLYRSLAPAVSRLAARKGTAPAAALEQIDALVAQDDTPDPEEG